METYISNSELTTEFYDDIIKMSESQFAAYLKGVCLESLEIRNSLDSVLPLIGIWLSVNPGKTDIIASVMATIDDLLFEQQINIQETMDADKLAIKEGFAIMKFSVAFILLIITGSMLLFYCYKFFIIKDYHYKTKFIIVLSISPLVYYIFNNALINKRL